MTTKPSNPKEAFGDARVPMDLAPDTAIAWMNMAFLEGALKYGKYNWRVCGVKVSTYICAMRRHIAKYSNGQNVDPKTKVHELASVMACCAILIDSEIKGNLADDRQPKIDMYKLFSDLESVVAHLKEEFKEYSPTQFTELEHGKSQVISGTNTTDTPIWTSGYIQETKPPIYTRLYGYKSENKVATIKAIRAISGMGLKEALDVLDNSLPFDVPCINMTQQEAIRTFRECGAS